MENLKMTHHRIGPVKAPLALLLADKSGNVGTRKPQRTSVHYSEDAGTLSPEA